MQNREKINEKQGKEKTARQMEEEAYHEALREFDEYPKKKKWDDEIAKALKSCIGSAHELNRLHTLYGFDACRLFHATGFQSGVRAMGGTYGDEQEEGIKELPLAFMVGDHQYVKSDVLGPRMRLLEDIIRRLKSGEMTLEELRENDDDVEVGDGDCIDKTKSEK